MTDHSLPPTIGTPEWTENLRKRAAGMAEEAMARIGVVASPVDLDRLRELQQKATRGPVAWRGYTDGSIELRTTHSGALRVLATQRTEPCLFEADDGAIYIAREACASCRHEWGKPYGAFTDRDTPCEKERTRATLWLLDHEEHYIRPANDWAVRAVPYRNDVVAVEHPDAEFLVAIWNAAPELIERADKAEKEAARLRKAIRTVEERADELHASTKRTAISGEDWQYTNGYARAVKDLAAAAEAEPPKEAL